MENNKGFTLVELVVAMAIMALVAVGISELMVTGARMFNVIDKDVKVQYESQLAMAQVEDYIIDCNGGIAWENGVLWVINVEKKADAAANEEAVVTAHTFRQDGDILKYGEITGTVTTVATFVPADSDEIMASYMTNFTVDMEDDIENNQQMSQIDIGMELDYKGSLYDGEQTFALRNKPYYHASVSELLNTLNSMK